MFYTPEQQGRLDQTLAALSGHSRSQVQKAIKSGLVLVDGSPARKVGQVVNDQSQIEWDGNIGEIAPLDLMDTSIALPKIEIVEETDDFMVINKHAGLLVHPTQANESGTLAHWVAQNHPSIVGVGEYANRPGIIHRLDKLASGLMIIAKTQDSFDHFKQQFKDRLVKKYYTVLVQGGIEADDGVIDFPIDRGKDGKMAARPRIEEITLKNVSKLQPGKDAKSEFWVQERYLHHTLLRVQIHTGRTHQIRVHMLAYNHPVVGDGLYSNNQYSSKKIDRLFLHASELCFYDLQGKEHTVTVPLPKELQQYLKHVK